MTGYRTIVAMGLALGVALWQNAVGPLPAIDPALVDQVQDLLVPLLALVLRFKTTTPVGVKGPP